MRNETTAGGQRDTNGTVAARLFGRGRQVDLLPSPWLIIGAAVALALVVGALTVANHDTEQQAMRRILAEKGASLIRSFEAGARTGLRGRMGGEMRLQVLLEEMADQPDIHFIAVTDRRGIVLAHSDPEWVGRALASPETMKALAVPPPPPAPEDRASCDMREQARKTPGGSGEGPGADNAAPVQPPSPDLPSSPPASPVPAEGGAGQGDAGQGDSGQGAASDLLAAGRDEVGWRLMDAGGQRAFLVYRTFIPLRGVDRPVGAGHMMRHRPEHAGNMMGGLPDWLRREMEADAQAGRGEPPVIIVALDTAPFDAARVVDHRHTVVMLFILGLLGAAGVVSLLWARHARASRRLLHQARDFALEVVTSLPDGLVVLDGSGRVATCNASARELLRMSDSTPAGAAPGDVLPAPLAQLAGRLTAAGAPRNEAGQAGAAEALRPDEEVTLDCPVAGGPPVPMSVRGVRIGSGAGDSHAAGGILILRDLREVRRLQDEVRRREKLAAIGSLAAGVAHELRNPLSSIKGYATYFGSRFDEGSEDREAARVMVQEVERLNRVISDLIGLARPSDIAPRPVDAAFLVQHVLRLVRQDAAHRGVTVRVEPQDADPQAVAPSGPAGGAARHAPDGGVPRHAPDGGPYDGVPRALLDPDRFSQALLNVFLNALEAMPHGGELTVRLAAAPGNRIAVSVRDTGTGIAPEHLVTIFDPYFTTKSQGTGLGLAIVHKIVEAHGGELSLRSAPGKGTEVTFLLPAEPVSATGGAATATTVAADAPASPESPATAKDDTA